MWFKIKFNLTKYLWIVFLATLGLVGFYTGFLIPEDFYTSPLQANYAKLFSVICLVVALSLTFFMFSETILKTSQLKLSKPIFPPLTSPKPKPRKEKVKAKPLTDKFTFKLLSKSSRLQDHAKKRSLKLRKDIQVAGETLNPYLLAAKSLTNTFITLFISLPVGIVLAVLFNPILLIVCLSPLVAFFHPKIMLKSKIGERRRGLEDEIPFFTLYISILQSVGINMYQALVGIIGKGIFKQLEKDALLVKRNVEYFGRSPPQALEEIASTHPNEKVRTLFLGYTSEWRSGGDLTRYLEVKAADYLADMKFRWQSYANRITDMGEVLISLFFLFPMMILICAFVFPGQALQMVNMMLLVGIPFLSLAVFMTIHTTQPKTYDVFQGKWMYGLIGGVMGLTVTFTFKASTWLMVVACVISATTLYGSLILVQQKEVKMLENALPTFLRNITEYRKMGYDINRAITTMSEEILTGKPSPYNQIFDKVLHLIAKQVKLGVKAGDVLVPVRSWLTKITFFLLMQVIESGGGTPRALENLANFINQVARIKREAKSSMRLYQILNMFTPVGLSVTIALMFGLIGSFQGIFNPTMLTQTPEAFRGVFGEALGLTQMFQIPPQLVESSYLMVVVSSLCLAMLTSKAVDLTSKNTVWIAVNLMLAAAGIASSGFIAQTMSRILGSVFTPPSF